MIFAPISFSYCQLYHTGTLRQVLVSAIVLAAVKITDQVSKE
jgi:hypothetical protein